MVNYLLFKYTVITEMIVLWLLSKYLEDLKKEGSHFDLPIALSIMFHNKEIDLNEYLVLGELGLDGRIKDTNSIFPIILSLRPKKVIIPFESAKKVSKIPGIEIYTFSHLNEFNEFNPKKIENSEFNYEYIKIKGKKYFYKSDFKFDFKDVIGQAQAKEAALISAAGFHNILFEGSPGVGKSMIINRLRYILPPMSLEEILEVEKLKAIEGKDVDFSPQRPFRSPHYSSTKAAIFGGGCKNSKFLRLIQSFCDYNHNFCDSHNFLLNSSNTFLSFSKRSNNAASA